MESGKNLLEMMLEYTNENAHAEPSEGTMEHSLNESIEDDRVHIRANEATLVLNNPSPSNAVKAYPSPRASGLIDERDHSMSNSCSTYNAGDLLGTLSDYQNRGNGSVDRLFGEKKFCSIEKTLESGLKDVENRLNAEYKVIREELLEATKVVVSREMQKVFLTAQQLRDQVMSLRELAKTQERTIARKDQVIDDLMSDLKRVNQNAESNVEKCYEQKEDFLTHFCTLANNQRLLRRVMKGWKYALETSWKSRFMNHLRADANTECERLKKEYTSQTRELEDELKSVKSEMESVRMSQTEENMTLRMALMRGVCALNMETLTLFNKQAQHNGVATNDNQPVPTQNSHNSMSQWQTKEVEQCYQEALNDLARARNTNNSMTNGSPRVHQEAIAAFNHPPGLPGSTNPTSQDAWPRITPLHQQQKPIDYNTHFNNWNMNTLVNNGLPNGMESTNHYGSNRIDHGNQPERLFDSKRPEPDMNAGSPRNKLFNSASLRYQQDQWNTSQSDTDESESRKEPCLRQTLPFRESLSKETRAYPRVTTCTSAELARKRLNSHTLSSKRAEVRSSQAEARHTVFQRPHTVQLGVPAGPSTHSSAVMAGVQVHRHQPVARSQTVMAIGNGITRKTGDFNTTLHIRNNNNNTLTKSFAASPNKPLFSHA